MDNNGLVLADYQKRCMDSIIKHIEHGEKHVSVLMFAGSGKKTISYFISRDICADKKILYVTEAKLLSEKIKNDLSKMRINADICTVKDLETKEVSNYDIVFLMKLGILARRYATEVFRDFNGTTVAFDTPFQETSSETANKRILAYANHLINAAFVYTTKTVVDIRDAVEAGEEEKDFIREQLKNQKNLYDEKEKQGFLKIEAVTAEKTQLERRIKTYSKKLSEMTAAKMRENELAQTRAEIERMRQEAKAKDEELERLREENRKIKSYSDLQEQLLNGVGILPEVVKEMYDKIESARIALLPELGSEDEEIQETAMHKLQNLVTDLVYEKTKNFVDISSERYEKIMIDSLSEKVWNEQLTDKSRSFLITAKANFDSLSNNPDIFDYSGVCLLVTKALEVEATRRFFHEYLDYLRNDNPDTSQWPESVRQRRGGLVQPDPITEEQFMLGSIVPFMGIKRLTDTNGNITGYRIRSRPDYNKFIDFAMQRLFAGLSRREVEQKLEQDYLFIERVRLDYRNPAAHKNALTSVSAEDCIKYVIETQKMLRKMLVDMVL